MGAWVETEPNQPERNQIDVAPYVGAWVETLTRKRSPKWFEVAPYVGAWVETQASAAPTPTAQGRTLRGCVG